MSVVKQSVTKGVGVIGVADGGVPFLGRELTGDESRATLGAFLDDLHEITALGVFEWADEPILDGKEVELGKSREHPGVRAIDTRDGEVVDGARRAHIVGVKVAPASALDEGTGEEEFPDTGQPSDILMRITAN